MQKLVSVVFECLFIYGTAVETATYNLKESFKYIGFYMLKQATSLASRKIQSLVPEAGER